MHLLTSCEKFFPCEPGKLGTEGNAHIRWNSVMIPCASLASFVNCFSVGSFDFHGDFRAGVVRFLVTHA